MKQLLIILIVLMAAGLTSCKKEKLSLIPAVITGYDMRKCMCCGGLMINFQNDTTPYSGNFYLVANDPAEFGIDINSSFPVYVEVDWKVDTSGCPGKIRITQLKKR